MEVRECQNPPSGLGCACGGGCADARSCILHSLVQQVQPLLKNINLESESSTTQDLLQLLSGICAQAEEVTSKAKAPLTLSRSASRSPVPQPFDFVRNYRMVPVARAPSNVFAYLPQPTGTQTPIPTPNDEKCVGWKNIFQVPVDYDVMLTPKIFDLSNEILIPKTGPRRRFLVIDSSVNELYGAKIQAYFAHHNVTTHVVTLPGEELNKRIEAVDTILEHCCVFGLRRREPIVAIGGGVILDIVGMAANMYRRGVPFIRVPTTLLAIVDASVGVKNGVDYCSCAKGPQKNRIGSFYAPMAAYADRSFIATQDARNIVNGFGEIMKLALVRSVELFELLEKHGQRLVQEKFQGADEVADRVIHLSIEIMLEELGPNLWEKVLDRCVDYGHTFSKILEMEPAADLMHGEAVNIDGMFCVVISHRRGFIDRTTRDRIFKAMCDIGLPTYSELCTPENMFRGLEDAIEHRHGQMRIPIITAIGSSVCVNDITVDEIKDALSELAEMHEGLYSDNGVTTSCASSTGSDEDSEEDSS